MRENFFHLSFLWQAHSSRNGNTCWCISYKGLTEKIILRRYKNWRSRYFSRNSHTNNYLSHSNLFFAPSQVLALALFFPHPCYPPNWKKGTASKHRRNQLEAGQYNDKILLITFSALSISLDFKYGANFSKSFHLTVCHLATSS